MAFAVFVRLFCDGGKGMIKRGTLVCWLIVITVMVAVILETQIFDGEGIASKQTAEQTEIQVQEAYYYELRDVSFDGQEVTGKWKDADGKEKTLRAKLPSAGNGVLHNGVTVILQSYMEPVNGEIKDCFYWTAR